MSARDEFFASFGTTAVEAERTIMEGVEQRQRDRGSGKNETVAKGHTFHDSDFVPATGSREVFTDAEPSGLEQAEIVTHRPNVTGGTPQHETVETTLEGAYGSNEREGVPGSIEDIFSAYITETHRNLREIRVQLAQVKTVSEVTAGTLREVNTNITKQANTSLEHTKLVHAHIDELAEGTERPIELIKDDVRTVGKNIDRLDQLTIASSRITYATKQHLERVGGDIIEGLNQIQENFRSFGEMMEELDRITDAAKNDIALVNDGVHYIRESLVDHLNSIEQVQKRIERDIEWHAYALGAAVSGWGIVNMSALVILGILGLLVSGLTRRRMRKNMSEQQSRYLGFLRSVFRGTVTILISLLIVSAVTLYHMGVRVEALLALGLTLSALTVVGFEVRARDVQRLILFFESRDGK